MVQKRNIPLVLVTGFLGSGKTTLIKYLMGNMDPGLRIGIVQNEYASANIDTSELQSVDRKFEVLEVNNGSVFCVCLLGSFIDSLAEFTDQYNPDLIEGNPDALLPALKELNPEAEILKTTYCQVPLNMVHEPVKKPLALLKEAEHRQYEPGGRVEISTVVLRTSRPIDRKGLDEFIREVESKLVRLKGFVLLSDQKIIRIQSEFGKTRMNEVFHYQGNTELIGLGWDITPAGFGRRFHDIRKSSEQHVI